MLKNRTRTQSRYLSLSFQMMWNAGTERESTLGPGEEQRMKRQALDSKHCKQHPGRNPLG
jgi:hypothetical protein